MKREVEPWLLSSSSSSSPAAAASTIIIITIIIDHDHHHQQHPHHHHLDQYHQQRMLRNRYWTRTLGHSQTESRIFASRSRSPQTKNNTLTDLNREFKKLLRRRRRQRRLNIFNKFIDSAINRLHYPTDPVQTPANSPVRITLPFKDQKSADVVCRRLADLGTKINQQLQPVFTSKKIADHLKVTEEKPPLINPQSVVYEFTCDLCDTYIGYTCRHLHQRVEEHKHSVIGKHFKDVHDLTPDNFN